MAIEDIGPVDYALVVFPGSRFTGRIAPALADLADAGTIRIIDIVFVTKDENGEVSGFDLDEVEAELRTEFERTGVVDEHLLSEEDVLAAAEDLEPGSSAALIVWENVWASRLAAAVRAADGVLVDFGRIPHEVVTAAREYQGVAS